MTYCDLLDQPRPIREKDRESSPHVTRFSLAVERNKHSVSPTQQFRKFSRRKNQRRKLHEYVQRTSTRENFRCKKSCQRNADTLRQTNHGASSSRFAVAACSAL